VRKNLHIRLALIVVFSLALMMANWRQLIAAGLVNAGYTAWMRAIEPAWAESDLLNGIPDETAATLWGQASELDPKNCSAWRGLGWVLMAKGHKREAVRAWRLGGLTWQDLVAHAEMARSAGRFKEALEWYEMAMDAAPTSRDLWYGLALTYREEGQVEKAVAALQRAALAPNGRVPLGSVYYALGHLLYRRFQPPRVEEAWEAFELALASDDLSYSDRLWAYCLRADILRNQGKFAEAFQEIAKALALDAYHFGAYYQLGLLYRKTGDVKGAEDAFLVAIQLEPSEKSTYWELVRLYQDSGRPDKAANILRSVVALDPNDRKAREMLRSLLGDE